MNAPTYISFDEFDDPAPLLPPDKDAEEQGPIDNTKNVLHVDVGIGSYIGRFPNLSNEQYHAAAGISSTALKYLEESPHHFENRHLFKFESDNLDFGTLIHTAVLEPENLNETFVVSPSFDKRTKKGKEDHAQFHAENDHKIIVTDEQMDSALTIAEIMKTVYGGILTGGEAESSFFVDDDGLLLKCRPDYYRSDLGIVFDLKSAADSSEFGMRKAITNYRYDRSAAFYLKVLQLSGYQAERFMFLFVEKSAPYMPRLREISAEALNNASIEIETMLNSYRHYKLTGKANFFKLIEPFASVGA